MAVKLEDALRASLEYFGGNELAAGSFLGKYALRDNNRELHEATPDDMHKRLAKEFARIEAKYPNPLSHDTIYRYLQNFTRIIPQGSPMMGIGNPYQVVSLGNCFSAGTEVHTTNRGVVNIENIEIGDTVVTHTGETKKVVQKHKNALGGRKVYEVKCFRSPYMKVTENHKFMSISKEQMKWGQKPTFNSLDYLRAGDYIQIPNKSAEGVIEDIDLNKLFVGNEFQYKDTNYEVIREDAKIKLATMTRLGKKAHKHFIPSFIKVDEDFAYFIGLWYGDGCVFGKSKGMLHKNERSAPNVVAGITFTLGAHEKKLVDFVTTYLTKLEIPTDVNDNSHIDGTVQIAVHSPVLGYAFEKMFGRGFGGKKLHPSMNTWSKTLIESLAQGIVDSDGTITQEGDVRVVLNNKHLIKEFYHLFRSVGMLVGYSESAQNSRLDFGRNVKVRNDSRKSYSDDRVSAHLGTKTLHSIEIDGQVFTQILSKTPVDILDEYVYTFGVEEDHSYSVEGLVAQNCFVVPNTYDSVSGIAHTDEQLANLFKRRCGVGVDISNLRPKDTAVKNAAQSTTGISTFMEKFSDTCRGIGQCIAEGERVLTKRGLIPIQDVIPGSDRVWTKVGWVLVSDVLSNGRKEVVETTTSRGYRIRTTKEHVFVDGNSHERPIGDFEVGENICLLVGTSEQTHGRMSLAKVTKDCLSAEAYALWLNETNDKTPNLMVDEVTSVEPCGTAKTYDLVLPEEHLFWCEGFYVHNSGRRGALLVSISCHHPEIKTFINIKKDLQKVTGANISVRWTDEFMTAVKNNTDVELRWPVDSKTPSIVQRVNAREVWDEFVEAAWQCAEPGCLFWDTITKNSPADAYASYGFGSVCANPCSEIVMSPDSCRLLLVNAFHAVKQPFTGRAKFDFDEFTTTARVAQRLMDDIVDLELEHIDRIIAKVESDPEPMFIKAAELDLWKMFRNTAAAGRRTGLGLTAIGDVIAALGMRYGSKESVKFVGELYKALEVASYTESVQMAEERGAFPIWNRDLEAEHPFLCRVLGSLDEATRLKYETHGRRNIANTTTPPAGTTSLLACLDADRKVFGTTSGIEPAYKLSYKRRKKINPNDENARVDFVDDLGDKWQEFVVYHAGYQLWEMIGDEEFEAANKRGEPRYWDPKPENSPYWQSTAVDVDWRMSVNLQAAAQEWIDHAISKTCNLPATATKELVNDVYLRAWETGCKGFTIYRDGSRSGVLVDDAPAVQPSTFTQTQAPKRPKELSCDIYHSTVLGEKWTIFVGMLDDKAYEIMGGLAKFVKIPRRVQRGKLVKHNGDINPARYDLHYDFDKGEDEETIIRDVGNVFENPTHSGFTRMISLALRHGSPVQYVVEQLVKAGEKESDLFSISKAFSRVLKNYIADGTKTTSIKKCSECGSKDLAYKDACVQCLTCGHSKCG